MLIRLTLISLILFVITPVAAYVVLNGLVFYSVSYVAVWTIEFVNTNNVASDG